MIRSLRRRHLVFGTAILALAPIAFLVAVWARSPRPVNAVIPVVKAELDRVPVPGLPIELGSRFESGDSGPNVALEFRATEPIPVADPLLYWAPVAPSSGSMPEAAILLGGVTPDRVARARLPAASLARSGWLVLWAGGYGRLVAHAPAALPVRAEAVP